MKTTFIFWSFFLSPRWSFFWSSENMAERHFWHIDIFFLKYFLVRLMIWLDAPYNTLEICALSEYFYHHRMSCGGNFPKASQEDFTNNSILGQFFIFSYSWSNFPKQQFLQFLHVFVGLISLNHSFFKLGVHLSKAIQN